MKKLLPVLAAALFMAPALFAQTSETTPPPNSEPTPPPSQADLLKTMPELGSRDIDSLIQFQRRTVSRILGIDLTTDGVLPRLRRVDNPFQLINPFAPAYYGSGAEVTSFHPRTGRAEGLVLIGIKF